MKTLIKLKLENFQGKYKNCTEHAGIEKVIDGLHEHIPALTQDIERDLESILEEEQRDIKSKIVARLAVEVMEVELHKDKDEFEKGHIHGIKRAIYLINQLKEKE